jgi:hypothetical protein
MFRALLAGLADYTIDERGDVGSWARMACIQSLTTFIRTITEHARSREELEGCLPADMFQSAIGGILKQGVERLDNVRQHAGEQFVQLLQMHPPRIEHAEAWSIANRPLLEELFLRSGAFCFDHVQCTHACSVMAYRGGTTVLGCIPEQFGCWIYKSTEQLFWTGWFSVSQVGLIVLYVDPH